jgi:D-alanyl-D-alanine carboxypeptidase/D-alanyl-D-alanine-endopeptidase (penicillin-binding protein 4)
MFCPGVDFTGKLTSIVKQHNILLRLLCLNFMKISAILCLFGSAIAVLLPHSLPTIAARAQSPETIPTALCEADLAAAIAPIQAQLPRSRWGILLQPVNRQMPIYAENASAYFIPASNVKLLTTAAVLQQFGPEFRIETPVRISGSPPIVARLHIAGRGDPSLTTAELEAIAQNLHSQGVREIQTLMIEDTHFPSPGQNGTWEYDDVHYYYGAAANSLILNRNHFDLIVEPQEIDKPVKLTWNDDIAAQQWQLNNQAITAAADTPYNVSIQGLLGQPQLLIQGELAVNAEPDLWGIAFRDPTAYFRDRFAQILTDAGIRVRQTQIVPSPQLPDPTAQALDLASPPLAVLIQNTNQPSDNLYAEALLHKLGISQAFPTRLDNSLIVLQQILSEMGVNPDSYHLRDGSGLSRQNLVTPEALVQTLIAMSFSPYADIYRDSLALAGVSGTLRRRFLDTPLEGQLRAKTGTLTGVSALAGYLNVPGYETLAFSIILNHSTADRRVQRQAIDEMVLLFSRVQPCDRVKSVPSPDRRNYTIF